METDLIEKNIFSVSNKKSRPMALQLLGLVFLITIVVGLYGFISALRPVRISDVTRLEVPEGYSVGQTAQELKKQNLIRSELIFKYKARFNNLVVKSGTYQFEQGTYSLGDVTQRLQEADYGNIYLSLTFPEGATRIQIADILAESVLKIDVDEFLKLTEDQEGYLFPDTYFFLPGDTAEDVSKRLRDTFTKKTENIKKQIESQGKNFEDIVIMGSLIEKEATNDIEEMRTVSGILWKRIEQGIPLQVDAPFLFFQGKTSAQLSTADLRKDGPYNTYTNKGLTPGPIANPGLDALEAASEPIESLYFFYLHDTNGNIHYAQTHDGHVRNKNMYLK